MIDDLLTAASSSSSNDDNSSSHESSSSLKGIFIVADNSDETKSSSSILSPAPIYPRGQNTPSSNLNPSSDYEWNSNYGEDSDGSGRGNLILRNMNGIPMVLVQSGEISAYLNEVAKNQSLNFLKKKTKSGSSESSDDDKEIIAEFTLYMGPSEMTTEECLSWNDLDGEWRPKCLPLGGNSVWTLAGSPYEHNFSTAEDEDNDDQNRKRVLNGDNDDNDNAKKGIIMVATNMDSTSMFHDVSPGANSAASNILTVLMAAKLVGENISDNTLDGLEKKIAFAVFQGEMYGFLGSRSFLKDTVLGFECSSDFVPAVSRNANKDSESEHKEKMKMACLHPLRYDMDFSQLGEIESMIAVDQVGIPTTESRLYIHADDADDGFLSSIFTSMSFENDDNLNNDWKIEQGSAGYIPPTPLSTFISLTNGGKGGIVLSGYDDAFGPGYLSHLDSNTTASRSIDLEAIALSATAVARAALTAAAGENAYYDTSSTIPTLSGNDESLLELANCLLVDGTCDLLLKYSKMEKQNNKIETGMDLGLGQSLGKPPNYYTGIFDSNNGQGFVRVGDKALGSYNGEDYGKNKNDMVLVRPSVLEMAVHGLFDDYLGRGSSSSSSKNNGEEEQEVRLKSCSNTADCKDISYCSSPNGDFAVCSGTKVCVCSRARYHLALDEAIVPAPNNITGMFLVSDDDNGVSALYSEPYWSNDIGVQVYRGGGEGNWKWMVWFGIATASAIIVSTLSMKKKLVKEQLY